MSRKPPTKAEAQRIERMLRLGCLCCGSPAECQHLTEGGRRLGHWWTIPLCPGCHRGIYGRAQTTPAVADGRKLFEAKYGPERELYRLTQERLGLPFSWPETKILPRRVA